ncbi:putative calcium-binding protein CML27 [Bienertia sinuspersici]
MKALGSETSQEELDQMMTEMDLDRDSYISLEEFAEFCSKKVEGDENGSQELRDAFDMYDQDKNGFISANELHLILNRLGEHCSVQDCSKMIESVDSNGDGYVSFDEFRKMMTKRQVFVIVVVIILGFPLYSGI